jgi:hypothetical protein
MLEMDFLSAPPVRDVVERNLEDFGSGVVDPGNPAIIQANMTLGYCWHTEIAPVYRSNATDSTTEVGPSGLAL